MRIRGEAEEWLGVGGFEKLGDGAAGEHFFRFCLAGRVMGMDRIVRTKWRGKMGVVEDEEREEEGEMGGCYGRGGEGKGEMVLQRKGKRKRSV